MPSIGAGGQRVTFFPKAGATVLQSRHTPPPTEARPTTVAPVFDVEHHDKPLKPWTTDVAETVYPSKNDIWAPALIPNAPSCPQECLADRYLFPVLARDERLRLTMLWYYTRGALEDQELMSRLQEKVHLAKETVGWEFVIAGLLNHNTYTRMVTVGLPLALLPRRESTCSHTINQPGAVFSLPNMVEDWRFKSSPHVEQGGLRSYAGVPLRFETEFGGHVAFGSLCVASNTPQEQLSKAQQTSLVRLADWIVADLVHSARARRQRDRIRMQECLSKAQKQCDKGLNMEEVIPVMLREAYPFSTVGIHRTTDGQINLGPEGGSTILQTSELEHGLWEDISYFDHMIDELNHLDMVAPKVVRIISTQCASQQIPTFLVVGSKDFRIVFDDVDAWFVQMFAAMLCRYWQGRALKEAKAAKKNFLRGITHQLRTPIHGILGSAELLTEELKSRNLIPETLTSSPSASPDLEKQDPYMYINTIKTSARELIGTVNSLIKLNQWAEVTQAKRSIGLHKITELETALLNETILALPDDLSIRPFIIISHYLPLDCDTFAIDMRLFLDTIQPLLLNAAKNSTVDGVVAATFSLTENYQSLIVDIEDNGSGIAPDHLDRIFYAYEKIDVHTTDAGLGLTMACKCATLLNGEITLVSSTLGLGSHFRATFHDPVCASSVPRLYALKDRLVRLPSEFHRIPSRDSTLGRHVCKYLTSKGYVESISRERTFLLIEYTSNLAQLYRHVSSVGPGQVAICLVPESAYFIDFGGSRIARQNRVVYVQASFLSSTLEAALELADAILAEASCVKSVSESAPSWIVTVDVSVNQSQLGSKDTAGITPHRESICVEAMQTSLVRSVEKLRLETSPTSLLTVSSSQSRKPMTLLVDDNVVNLRLLEMYCNRRGLPYRTAKDGREAVRMFSEACLGLNAESIPCNAQDQRTASFDLILMDLQMPICDGIDATKQIREMETKIGCKKSVLFIVTGQDSPSDRTNAEEAGSDGYLVKPVGPKVLDKWVKQWFPDAEL